MRRLEALNGLFMHFCLEIYSNWYVNYSACSLFFCFFQRGAVGAGKCQLVLE